MPCHVYDVQIDGCFPRTLTILLQCILNAMIAISLIVIPLQATYLFSLAVFKGFSLSLVFFSLTTKYVETF